MILALIDNRHCEGVFVDWTPEGVRFLKPTMEGIALRIERRVPDRIARIALGGVATRWTWPG